VNSSWSDTLHAHQYLIAPNSLNYPQKLWIFGRQSLVRDGAAYILGKRASKRH
jgi:hypothetical protein